MAADPSDDRWFREGDRADEFREFTRMAARLGEILGSFHGLNLEFGVALRPGMNASAQPVASGGAAILFDFSLLHHLLLWNGLCMKEWPNLVRPSKELYVNATRIIFDDLLFWLTSRQAGRYAVLGEVAGDTDIRTAYQIIECQMIFLASHELGHVTSGDFSQAPGQPDPDDPDRLRFDQGHLQEITADLFALKTSLHYARLNDVFSSSIVFAIPLFFGVAALIGEVVALARREKSPILETSFTEERFLFSHPDADKRNLIAFNTFSNSVDAAEQFGLPQGPESFVEEGQYQWRNCVIFTGNCLATLMRGDVDVHGLFKTPVALDLSPETMRMIRAQAGRFGAGPPTGQ